MAVGARMKVAGGGLVTMTAVIAAILLVGGPGIDFTCTHTYNDYFALTAAVNDTGNSGATLCVDTDMGAEENITLGAAMSSDTRIIAFPPTGTITAPGFVVAAAGRNYTIEGFEFTGENTIGIEDGAQNVRIVKNYAHDQHLDFVVANTCENGGKQNIEILGNRIAGIQIDGEFPDGYGVYGACFDGIKFNYNECDGKSDGTVNVMGDCFEISQAHNFESVGNWIHDMRCSACGETHTDGIQWWSNSSNGLIENNVIDGSAQNTLSPDSDDVVMHNNLIVDGQGNCFDTGANGSSGDVQLKNTTISNNTIWTCGFYAWYGSSGAVGSGRGNNIVTDNIMERNTCLSAGMVAITGNVTHESSCMTEPDNFIDPAWTPDWGTTNTGNHPTYQASNLPLGFEGAGYRPAPYGPLACPC